MNLRSDSSGFLYYFEDLLVDLEEFFAGQTQKASPGGAYWNLILTAGLGGRCGKIQVIAR